MEEGKQRGKGRKKGRGKNIFGCRENRGEEKMGI